MFLWSPAPMWTFTGMPSWFKLRPAATQKRRLGWTFFLMQGDQCGKLKCLLYPFVVYTIDIYIYIYIFVYIYCIYIYIECVYIYIYNIYIYIYIYALTEGIWHVNGTYPFAEDLLNWYSPQTLQAVLNVHSFDSYPKPRWPPQLQIGS